VNKIYFPQDRGKSFPGCLGGMKRTKAMKAKSKLSVLIVFFLIATSVCAQESNHVQTVFSGSKASGGYGALNNKFTNIGGDYANLVEVYGGWYINHKFLLGIGAGATTNNIPVPLEYSVDPLRNMSYEYGQVGLVTEYVFGSNKTFHFAFNLFSGAGFTLQYERYGWHNLDYNNGDNDYDENWFFVAEPGVQVEINLLKWMRFSPGISYRAAFGSDAPGLSDNALSDISYNATLKFGKF